MKKTLLIFLFIFSVATAKASHIVGGEFELLYLSGNNYRLNLILYFDELNGTPGAQDPQAVIRIFRKRDNAIMLNSFQLFLTSRTDVEYTQLECSDGEIVTDKLLYTGTLFLSPDIYNDPEGYYISWERCCRNYQITNIYSENPQAGGTRFAGQTFYLEFPPVVKDGQPFINNSPRLFPPLNDFACPYIPYYVDFTGVDDDGDSLVYTMVDPLNTHTADALPPNNLPRPGPYPSVEWRTPFGLNNIINGVTNLEISANGFLTVTPKDQGLYVFAVKCEEFRDGVKIGEVRRDFQMLVVQTGGCPDPNNPPRPSIVGKGPLDAGFGTSGNLTVSYANTVPLGDRCFEVKVSDPSALMPEDGSQENIKIRAVALDFNKKIDEILPTIKTAFLSNGSEAVFEICFPNACPYKASGTFNIGIVATDDACALPLTDTLYVTVTIEPPPNDLPQFTTPTGTKRITETIEEGDAAHSWPITVTDANADVIKYRIVTEGGFNLADVGMTFDGTLNGQQLGPLQRTLTWDPKCDVYDFTNQTNFKVYFIVDDVDDCGINKPDTTIFDLTIDLPGNNDPVIDNDVLSDAEMIELSAKIHGDPLVVDVTGTDLDIDDVIVLRASGVDFSPAAVGATFPKQEGNGTLQSVFEWSINCNAVNLLEKSDFEFHLMVVDSTNKCGFYKADTLRLLVHVEPPDNEAPLLQLASNNAEQVITDNTMSAFLRSPISITLTGTDTNVQPIDQLSLTLLEYSGDVAPEGFSFTPVQGATSVETIFKWEPDCSIFIDNDFENNYTFKFLLSDNRCFNAMADTVTLALTVKDLDGSGKDFLPPNIFTPNGDNKNDFFAMVKEEDGELINILPNDNCLGEFVSLTIYNRWGNQVYQTVNREFRWYGADMPIGVYFYYIKFTNKEYKGSLTLRF